MAIGLTARQKSDLAAMLPNIEESITSLKRLIADSKDRTKAMSRLNDAEDAHKRHANDLGIPFNADAFARRREELKALPQTLTVEEGQLAAFAAMGRALSVVAEGPYTREGRGGSGTRTAAAKQGTAPTRVVGKGQGGGKSSAGNGAARKATARNATTRKSSALSKPSAPSKPSASKASVGKTGPSTSATGNAAAKKRDSKPTPLSLGG